MFTLQRDRLGSIGHLTKRLHSNAAIAPLFHSCIVGAASVSRIVKRRARMENPRSINRCFYGLFMGLLVVSMLVAILTHDSQPLLWGLVVVALFVVVCGAAALLNLALFPPLFRLLAKLTRRKSDSPRIGK